MSTIFPGSFPDLNGSVVSVSVQPSLMGSVAYIELALVRAPRGEGRQHQRRLEGEANEVVSCVGRTGATGGLRGELESWNPRIPGRWPAFGVGYDIPGTEVAGSNGKKGRVTAGQGTAAIEIPAAARSTACLGSS